MAFVACHLAASAFTAWLIHANWRRRGVPTDPLGAILVIIVSAFGD